MSNKPLNPQEAASVLRVHRETIYSMVRNKEIPHFRIGKKIFFRPETLNAWISQLEQNSVDDPA
ncbi:helix-turn-helix domain-containing protein [Bacillus subtilis]|uniref:helix-turn-helix domain-containing protein n=1 Tax=Bacillus subtilis TaxID=1423 RepID=UPI00103FB041|nr:helix-turn-helix domain-containing protein [Bacillus subtilis]QBJ80725.1 DNA-binding protein [Bacillus subtilis subsp. subtilis]